MFVHMDEKMHHKINILSQSRFNLHKIIACKVFHLTFLFQPQKHEYNFNLTEKSLGIRFTLEILRPNMVTYSWFTIERKWRIS